MSIINVTGKTGYINDFTNAGLIFSDNGVIIIDNGWGVKEGRKILEILDNNNLKTVALINTHAHVDHCGANAYIQKQTGCKVYSSHYESLLLGEPMLLPFLFSGKAAPLLDGTTSAFKNSSMFEAIVLTPGKVTIDGAELEVIELPGHTYGHIGVVCDNVLFCGDAVMSEAVMRENDMVFYSDPSAQRKTLNYIMNSSFDAYIPSHGKYFTDQRPACEMYLELIDRVENYVLDVTKAPQSIEKIISHVCSCLGMSIESYGAYSVVKVPITATANILANKGRLKIFFKDNILYYHNNA